MVGPGVIAPHREGMASMADHLEGFGNFNIFLGLREITKALPCRVHLGGDPRVELHALQGPALGSRTLFCRAELLSV